MWTYEAPLSEMRFVIDEVLGAPQSWARQAAYSDLDADTAGRVLDEAARFASEMLLPINGPGDLQGCSWQGGEVQTPDGYVRAYRAFVDGGWPALACDPAYGGQGAAATVERGAVRDACRLQPWLDDVPWPAARRSRWATASWQ